MVKAKSETATDLLPSGGGASGDDEDLRVNFAGVEVRDFTALPPGKYPVEVTDGELRYVKDGKNEGKGYVHWEFTVLEGQQYAGRKFWTNAMLFEPALFSIKGLCAAVAPEWEFGDEFDARPNKGNHIPKMVSRKLIIRVSKRAETEEYDASNEVKGYYKLTDEALAASTSLLP